MKANVALVGTRRLIALAIIPGIVVATGYAAVQGRSAMAQAGVTAQTPQAKAQIAEPEAVALVLHLLERYAENVPDKNELDRGLERALARNPRTQEGVRRLVDRYRRIPPAQRRPLLGKWADLAATSAIPLDRYRTVFQRLMRTRERLPLNEKERSPERSRLTPKHARSESPAKPDEPEILPPEPGERGPFSRRGPLRRPQGASPAPGPRLLPASLRQPEPRFQFFYNGLWAHHETDEDHLTDSDEIYVIFTIVDESSNIVSNRRPSRDDPPYYWDVDDGEYRPASGRIARLWGGSAGRPAQDLALTVSVFEQDSGDPDAIEAAIDGTWAAAIGICSLVGEANPAVCGAALVAALGIDAVVSILTGGGDDTVEIKTVQISAAEMRAMADSDLITLREEDIPSHVRTIHNGHDNAAGADYHVYFAFHPAQGD